MAVFLLYFNAVLGLFALLRYGSVVRFGSLLMAAGALVVAGSVAAGYGIANERRWGYGLGLAMAFLPFLLRVLQGGGLLDVGLVQLMFEIALIALLLHPQSREYQRIWFK